MSCLTPFLVFSTVSLVAVGLLNGEGCGDHRVPYFIVASVHSINLDVTSPEQLIGAVACSRLKRLDVDRDRGTLVDTRAAIQPQELPQHRWDLSLGERTQHWCQSKALPVWTTRFQKTGDSD